MKKGVKEGQHQIALDYLVLTDKNSPVLDCLTGKKVSILKDRKFTEDDALSLVRKSGCLSPVYLQRKRDGCVLCSNASEKERAQWYRDYPGAYDRLFSLQEKVISLRPGMFPLRNYKYFIDPHQLNFWR